MRTSASYRLGEVGGYADDQSRGIPPAAVRENLKPGEQAWLMVEFPEKTEPAWAEVREVLGPGWYLGRSEEGEAVEFGSEHVFGISGPRFQMGAWYDFLPGERPASRKPEPPPVPPPAPEAKAPPWYEFLPSGPRAAARGPSVFDVWKRGAPAEPVEKKKGFWEFFRRKPKTSLEPIPPAERREQRPSFLRLPGRVPEPPVPPAPAEGVQEAAQPASQAIIVPEAPKEVIVRAEGPSRPPDELFEVLGPAPALPGVPPPAPPAPGAMIVGPQAGLPAQADAFSVLEPAQAETYGPPAELETPFTAIRPFEAATPFTMIQPSEAPTPFDILDPAAAAPEQGLVVRPEQGVVSSSVFDILEPAPGPLAPYVEPPPAPGPTVFDAIEPEPPKRAPAKQKKAAKKKGSKLPFWDIPTREEWVEWIRKTYKPIENLWTHIRQGRNDEYFIEEQLYEEESGQPPLVPIETWADAWNFSEYLPFFGVPEAVWGPYAEKMDEENEQYGYADEAWEEMQINVLHPLEDALQKAFKSIQPSDLPGYFVLAFDEGSGTWGLCYYEHLDPKYASKRQREALAARERDEREAKEEERRRKVEIKRIWGGMPRPEDLIPWIEEKFDLEAMFKDIQKATRLKSWKQDLKEYGEAAMTLEEIADLGPKKAKDYEYDIAAYFGIPPDLVRLYEEANSGQELWNEIFWPFFDSLSEAFMMLLPYANLPGMITVDEDDEDHLIMQYVEQEPEE